MVAGRYLGRRRHPLPHHLRRLRPVRAHPARRCLCAACCSRGAGGDSRAALQRHGHRRPGHRRGLHRAGADGAGLVGRPAGAPVHPGGRPWHPVDFHPTQVAILPSAGLDRLVRCFHPGGSPILRPAWPADARRAYGHLPDLRRRHHLVPYPLAGNAETVRPGPRRGQCDGVLPAHRCHSARLRRVVRPHCLQPGRLLRADGVCCREAAGRTAAYGLHHASHCPRLPDDCRPAAVRRRVGVALVGRARGGAGVDGVRPAAVADAVLRAGRPRRWRC